jgi:hypothetical protein
MVHAACNHLGREDMARLGLGDRSGRSGQPAQRCDAVRGAAPWAVRRVLPFRIDRIDPGAGERPKSQLVLDALYAGARSGAANLRAVAVVADVRLARGGDAVRVELEHKEGTVLVVLLPYSRTRRGLKKTITFGQMTVSAGHQRVWDG